MKLSKKKNTDKSVKKIIISASGSLWIFCVQVLSVFLCLPCLFISIILPGSGLVNTLSAHCCVIWLLWLQYDKCAHCAGSGSHCRAGLFDGYERRLTGVRLHFTQTVQPQEDISHSGQVGGVTQWMKTLLCAPVLVIQKVALMIQKLGRNANKSHVWLIAGRRPISLVYKNLHTALIHQCSNVVGIRCWSSAPRCLWPTVTRALTRMAESKSSLGQTPPARAST